MRTIYGPNGYGREKYREFDGNGLFAQMRAVIASPLSNVKAQKPIVKWKKHDGPRLRAKECVKRLLRRVK